MPRLHERMMADLEAWERLRCVGEGAPSMDDKCRIIGGTPCRSAEMAPRVDRMFVEERRRHGARCWKRHAAKSRSSSKSWTA